LIVCGRLRIPSLLFCCSSNACHDLLTSSARQIPDSNLFFAENHRCLKPCVSRAYTPNTGGWSSSSFSLAMFGSYYVYDALSPLADVLKSQLGVPDLNIGFLQVIYSFPNIFTVVIGGFLIDRIDCESLDDIRHPLFIGAVITAVSGAPAAYAQPAR